MPKKPVLLEISLRVSLAYNSGKHDSAYGLKKANNSINGSLSLMKQEDCEKIAG
jgi:hypothetical protein